MKKAQYGTSGKIKGGEAYAGNNVGTSPPATPISNPQESYGGLFNSPSHSAISSARGEGP